jgi:RNA polymerase sigma factor (sigma-70 family)
LPDSNNLLKPRSYKLSPANISDFNKLHSALRQHLALLGVDPGAFYSSARKYLRQYHLDGYYTPDDVINEVLHRWYKKPESERSEISWTEGWMKKTALRCIQEFRRKETPQRNKEKVQFVPLDDPLGYVHELADSSEFPEYDPLWQSIRNAMKELSDEERELLNLSVVHELSGQELVQHYAAKGEKVQESTIRKRKERALVKLRKIVQQYTL